MQVPQLDLKREYELIKDQLLKKAEEVLASGRYILGPHVNELEKKIAEYTGTHYAKGVASGSDALLLSMMAIGLKRGEGVITTPFTFFATASAAYRVGGIPVFADIDEKTFNISPDSILNILEKGEVEEDGTRIKHYTGYIKIRAIVPVHLFGQAAEMDKIMEIARKFNLKVVEDAAQSIGAEFDGKKVGTFGNLGIYSFFPTKNLGTAGDGGMVVTNDEKLDHLIKILRVHGAEKKYFHTYVGVNSRLDELHAAFLLVKLNYLDKWSNEREKRAQRYINLFKETGLLEHIELPYVHPKSTRHVWNQFVIRAKKRDALKNYLKEKGIGTNIYYPLGLHLQKCFVDLDYKEGDFPITEKATREVLALPMHPFLTEDEQSYVVEKIKEFYHAL